MKEVFTGKSPYNKRCSLFKQLEHVPLVMTRSTPALMPISQPPPLQSTFTPCAASTECTANVFLQILVQAAALPQREAGRWRGKNSFLGKEKREGGGVQGANRLTGDLFEGEQGWRVKPSQRERHKKVRGCRYVLTFPPTFLLMAAI